MHQGGSRPTRGSYNDCNGLTGAHRRHRRAARRRVDVVVSGHTHQAYNCVHRRQARHQRLVVRPRGHRHRPDARPAHRRQVVQVSAQQRRSSPATCRRTRRCTAIVDRYTDARRADRQPRHRLHRPAPLTRRPRTPPASRPWATSSPTRSSRPTDARDCGGAAVAFMNPGGMRADLRRERRRRGRRHLRRGVHRAAVRQQPGDHDADRRADRARCWSSSGDGQARDPNPAGRPRASPTRGAPPARRLAGGPRPIKINGTTVDPAATYRVTVNSSSPTAATASPLRNGTDRLAARSTSTRWRHI